jgi:hypothetical protein
MKQIVRIGLLVAVVAAGALLAGCGETYDYEGQAMLVGVPLPMTTEEVVAAAKAGQSEDAIISQLQQRGYEGALTTKDVDSLRADGVPEHVVDWMLANPGPQPFASAPIVGTVEGVPSQQVVYVEREPSVVVVERPPLVTYSIGFGYTWGHYHHYPRYRSHYRYERYPRTRVIQGSHGRVYRYTGRH